MSRVITKKMCEKVLLLTAVNIFDDDDDTVSDILYYFFESTSKSLSLVVNLTAIAAHQTADSMEYLQTFHATKNH